MTSTPAAPLRQAARSGAMWSLAQSWGGRLVSTAAFVVLARVLDPTAFGVVALATIFIDLGQLVINRGFGAAIVQRADLADEDLDSAFWFAAGCGLVLAGASMVSAGWLASAFDEPGIEPVLRVLSLNWILGALASVPQSLLQRELRFRQLALRRMLAVTSGGVIGIVLASLGAGVWSLVVMTLTQSAMGVAVLWTVCPWRPSWRVSADSFRRTRRFSASVVGVDLVRFASQRGEGFLIAAAIGSVSLGLYTVATRCLLLLNEVFTSTIGAVAFPVFSRLQHERARRERALLAVVRMSAVAAFPAFGGLAVLAPELVPLALGERWDASVVLVQLLCLHGLRVSVTYFVSNVIVSTGNAGLELRITCIGAALKLAALAVGVQWGVRGVAMAVVVASYLTLPLTFWGLRRATGITAARYLAQVAAPAVAAAVMVVAVVVVTWATALEPPIVTAVAGVLAGLAFYVPTLGILAPRLVDEAAGHARELLSRRARQRVARA